MDFLDELNFRGLIHQASNMDGMRVHLASGTRLAYIGFDPTADSLTIGNLVALKMLSHFQRAGHIPVVVMGGGTGLIGDPSGKTTERPLLSEEQVAANITGQLRIFSRFLDLSPGSGVLVLNNATWLKDLRFLDVLRDVGKHFSVNVMLQKDAVKNRLAQGLSFAEFSYSLLQAFDFYHLHNAHNVTIQMGGSDQWGNMVAGVDYVRRESGKEVFALTAPLLTRADGGKFGKTESGAVWLTADRTTPFSFFQFWINTSDQDLSRFLRIFTFFSEEQIDDLLLLSKSSRQAHRTLALHMTELLHGAEAAKQAEAISNALFSGSLSFLTESDLVQISRSIPCTDVPPATSLLDLLVLAKVAPSRREARQLLQNRAIRINDQLVERDIPPPLPGGFLGIRRGTRQWFFVKIKK